MPPEQQWFWWVTRQEYSANKALADFYAELCADDIEAFQSPNLSIFDIEVISSLRENAKPPVAVLGLIGPQSEVPPILQPNHKDIDHSRPFYDIRASWNPVGPTNEYRLVPLLHHGSAQFDPLGKFLIWELPREGQEYGIGCDTGMGLGLDRSVLEGLRKGTLEENDEQVFEFASPYINSFNLWPFNLAIGTFYSTKVNGQFRQAKQVVELAANGENVVNELKKRGWRNFHMWVRYDRKRSPESHASRIGWYTNSWSRPMMMDMLIDAINNGWLDINSSWFIDEMADLELELEKQKVMAAYGAHDDRIMAKAMVLFSLHASETRHKDRWVTRERMERRSPNPIYAKYNPGYQGMPSPEMAPNQGSYTYRVITSSHRDADTLRGPGAVIWSPSDE